VREQMPDRASQKLAPYVREIEEMRGVGRTVFRGRVPDGVVIASCDTNTFVSSLSYGRHLGGALCYVFDVFGFVGLMDGEPVRWEFGGIQGNKLLGH
jgi:hypothetical protein